MIVGQAGFAANAREAALHVAARSRPVIDVGNDAEHEGKNGRRTRADQSNRGTMTGAPAQFFSNQQTNSKADGSLGKGHDARYRNVLTKLIERNERHGSCWEGRV